jgi:hypothetical protein
MKCPKCGYHSFEHLDSCKKCGQGLAEHKTKFKLWGFCVPGQKAVAAEPTPVPDENLAEEQPADDRSRCFGFNLAKEQEDPFEALTGGLPLDDKGPAINIYQPFSVDSEILPADSPGSLGMPAKGSGFGS